MDVTILIQIIISGLLIGFVFALVAVGLTLIWGVIDIINFAHGEFMMIAMYASLLIFTFTGIDPVFSLPVSALLLFLIGLLTYRLVIRPVLGHSGLVALLATFGLSIFIRNLALLFFGPDFRVIQSSLLAGKRFEIMNINFSLSQVVASIGCVIITYLVYLFISKSKIGRAIRATALDRDTALLMGINTNRVFALTFAIGSACVGIAGGFLVNFYYVFPDVGLSFVIISFVIVALGGFGNIGGAFLAGIIVGLVENVGGFLVAPEFKYTLVFILYLIVIFLRPKGLFGW